MNLNVYVKKVIIYRVFEMDKAAAINYRVEDFVEYFVFPPNFSNPNTEEDQENDKVLAQLDAIQKEFCKEYLWHKDPFRLLHRRSYFNACVSLDEGIS